MDKSKQLYEVVYLISPAYSGEEAKSFHQSIKNKVQTLGGSIEIDESIIKRRLAYPVKKMAEAHLASCLISLDADKIAELKNDLSSKEVLRSMLAHGKHPQPKSHYAPRPIKHASEKITKTQENVRPAANIEEIDKKLEEILGK